MTNKECSSSDIIEMEDKLVKNGANLFYKDEDAIVIIHMSENNKIKEVFHEEIKNGIIDITNAYVGDLEKYLKHMRKLKY